MHVTHFAAACWLACFVGAETVPGAPQYVGATARGIEPWPPGVARWSELYCVRPSKAVNGSTLPVWEKKDGEEGGDGSGKEGEGEGQGDGEGVAKNVGIDSVSMFGLSALALACLMVR